MCLFPLEPSRDVSRVKLLLPPFVCVCVSVCVCVRVSVCVRTCVYTHVFG